MRLPRVRFSVRRAMALVLVLAVWLAWEVRRAGEQRDAVAALRRGGGQVLYHWQWKDFNPYPAGEPWAPRRLVDALGPDLFGHVHYVWFRRVDAPPDWPTAFALAGQGHPERSRALSAEAPSRTDALVPLVRRLSGLRNVNLGGSDVTDAGLAHLEGMTGLTTLYVDSSKVTDAGLARLRGLTGLEDLFAGDTRVGDAGLAHLRTLTRLRMVFLNNTRVTDAGLTHLAGLPALRQVDLRGSMVTAEGVQALRQALPGATVFW